MHNDFTARGKFILCALLLAAAALPAFVPLAHAQTRYRIDQALGFGLFGINNNNATHELIVDINGLYSADPAFVLTTPTPTNGEIFLDGLDPSVPFNITFANGSLSLNGGGVPPVLSIVNFTTNGPFTTTAGGTLDVLIGATLRTSGSGVPYESGPYEGTFDITFDY